MTLRRAALTPLALSVLAPSLLASCIEPFQDPTILDSLRILSAQVEPPEIRPDQSFEVTPLIYAPRGTELTYRWAACILEIPFTRPLGGGGGGCGGAQNSEAIPSEQGPPPPSCIDRQGIIEPLEVRDDGSAGFEIPFVLRGLLDQIANMELPDIDPEDVPEELRDLLTLPDQLLLAVLHGVNLTISLEVSDGTETLLANKKLPVKLIPPPGPAVTPVADDEPGPVDVEFGWEDDKLHLTATFRDGSPPPAQGHVLRIYLPLHYWDPTEDVEAPAVVVSNGRSRSGKPLVWFGHGARHEIAIDLTKDPAVGTISVADGAGGWTLREGKAPEVTVAGRTVRVSVALEDVELLGRAVAFQVTVSRDGDFVDAIPEEGWRYAHGGPPNTNPPPPVVEPGRASLSLVPDELDVADRETYPVVTIRGEVVDSSEKQVWSWFTDQGQWASRRTRGGEPDPPENSWLRPEDLQGEATQFLVVRDGRGGAAWTDLTGRLPLSGLAGLPGGAPAE